jgi:[acyl-carrier-protein] S-malonyltransferase
MKVGLIFPGQGVQLTNMGMDILAAYPDKENLFTEIANITNVDVKHIITKGSEAELTDPHLSSIIVFSISVMITEILKENNIQPVACAGYSIGQYAALNACNAFGFSDGLKLVSKRGELLKKYASTRDSGMLGIIGLTEEQIMVALKNVDESYIANYSTPTNFSLSYKLSKKEQLIAEISKLNPIKIVEIPVQGGWHSKFMMEAATELQPYLNNTNLNIPSCLFYDNYTGSVNADVNEIKNNLYHHVYSPVKWYQSVKNMVQDGVDTFIEVGYGDQLSKFSMLINRRVKVYNTSNITNLSEVIKLAHQ